MSGPGLSALQPTKPHCGWLVHTLLSGLGGWASEVKAPRRSGCLLTVLAGPFRPPGPRPHRLIKPRRLPKAPAPGIIPVGDAGIRGALQSRQGEQGH